MAPLEPLEAEVDRQVQRQSRRDHDRQLALAPAGHPVDVDRHGRPDRRAQDPDHDASRRPVLLRGQPGHPKDHIEDQAGDGGSHAEPGAVKARAKGIERDPDVEDETEQVEQPAVEDELVGEEPGNPETHAQILPRTPANVQSFSSARRFMYSLSTCWYSAGKSSRDRLWFSIASRIRGGRLPQLPVRSAFPRNLLMGSLFRPGS